MDKQKNQLEAFPNYDEYNQNNRLVNDVNYSYYFHKNQNWKIIIMKIIPIVIIIV